MLSGPSSAELMEFFLNEMVQYSKEHAIHSYERRNFIDPQILRSDGLGYPVSQKAIGIAHRLAAVERASSPQIGAQFSAATHERLSLMALGDTISHLKETAASSVDSSSTIETEAILQFFRLRLEENLARARLDLYRHIPCHLFHNHKPNATFFVGPIQFSPRTAWAKRFVVEEPVRAETLRAWDGHTSPQEQLTSQNQLAVESVLRTIGNHGWVGTVFIRGHDAESSHAKANVLVDLALDSLNLMLEPADGILLNRAGVPFFPGGARLGTTLDGTIVSGSSARLPGLGGHPNRTGEFLAETSNFREAVGRILTAYADAHHEGRDAPWLVERWVNSLHWFGQARREASDFMSVVKYGCALDILSGAGGNLGKMTSYVEAAFGIAQVTDQAGRTVPLEELINNLFNDGRSALAHGEAFGLLNDRSADRARADAMVRHLLAQVAEPLAKLVETKDRVLSVDKDAQIRAFTTRLRNLSRGGATENGA